MESQKRKSIRNYVQL